MVSSIPAPTELGEAAFASEHKLVVLFGGEGSGYVFRNDTWAWDGQVWTQMADTGPNPRRLHAMAFDSTRQRTVLFGGLSLTPSNETRRHLGTHGPVSFRRNKLVAQGNAVRRLPPHSRSENRAGSETSAAPIL